ncbi:hypothetical protein Lfu02_55210 [Longispora fulva]|uniref:Uncharacterized protein n=1 Tax=Longispora fulva TaxID=619741 RepID=A0A8J7GJ68_9ACTN|nr:LysR family transcriptional regulator [Longispora fulva]MBG6137498.1 hypothetical protein [Longispora fulva]GIG61149.1 hypothetical protein Lfu02_55210 [Longispora fulva]
MANTPKFPVEPGEFQAFLDKYTFEEIAEIFEGSVSGAKRAAARLGLTKPNIQLPKSRLPWRVLAKHNQNGKIPRLLRTGYKLELIEQGRQDIELATWEIHEFEVWERQIRRAGVVVDYDPDFEGTDLHPEGGWMYAPRQPGDEGLIREPDGVSSHLKN